MMGKEINYDFCIEISDSEKATLNSFRTTLGSVYEVEKGNFNAKYQ